MLIHEIRVWSRLNHPNILPFVGYALESNDCPLLISEWMEDGTINKYVKSHPDCDISHIVRSTQHLLLKPTCAEINSIGLRNCGRTILSS